MASSPDPQPSPEGSDVSMGMPLTEDQRISAGNRLYQIVEHFESKVSDRTYSQPRLIRLTYEHSRSEESRDLFTRTFFHFMAFPFDSEEDPVYEELESGFNDFADHLMNNLFLPLKVSAARTPQPTAVYPFSVQEVTEGEPASMETPDSLPSLRGACLTRDHHRCVITRKFDDSEAMRRFVKDEDDAQDDDGTFLLGERPEKFNLLEVAHILPRSLTRAEETPRKTALEILSFIDLDVARMLQEADADQPGNAMTLCHDLHLLFGAFKIFFEPLPGEHTYRIRKLFPRSVMPDVRFPVTRTLFGRDAHAIDPPSPRILAVHRAVSHILQFSGAGLYIDKILRDVTQHGVREDGSTDVGRLLCLGMGGWFKKAVHE